MIETIEDYKQWCGFAVDANACCAFEDEQKIRADLLAYRRENNIFEVGDNVVFEDDEIYTDESKVYEIVEALESGEFVLSNDDCIDPIIIRHATYLEIKAGHRL